MTLPNEGSQAGVLKAQLRNTPVAADVDLDYIASQTHGFSGADFGFVTQRAAKIAIKQAISAEAKAQKGRGAGDDAVEAEYEDPVPELTKAHFEEAMQSARRSVSDVEVRRYEAFAQSMKQSGGMNVFRFPTAEEVGAGQGQGNAGGYGQDAEDDDLYT